ncbi:DUF1850 domain-containing protein [Halorubrum depositum]|uniref:DUF1850 domain-containing protein n=1 Tax=Halorubrum depositum TaxID=2583992 RepID=UPI0011AAA530|nr:DUF1850 domain-containing protein [Halorubrum depositum]
MTLGSRATAIGGGSLLVAGAAVLALLAILAGVALGGADPVTGERTLVVTDDDGAELLATPVGDETEIVIEYTHSVEKTLVRDVYVASDDGLVMTRMEFSSFGAGLPSQADVTERDGRYVYDPPSTTYETLHLKTGAVADHDLIVGGERYDIAAMSDDGAVELTVERR